MEPPTVSAQPLEVPVEQIDRSIYAMPAFTTLPVTDMSAAEQWYCEGAGFVVLARMGPLVHLRRYRYQDLLLVPGDDVGGGGARTSFICSDLDEQAAAAARARALGTGTVEGPLTTPWYSVETTFTDPDGHVIVLTGRGTERPPERFDEMVRDSVVRPEAESQPFS